jgi:hypothetical protein
MLRSTTGVPGACQRRKLVLSCNDGLLQKAAARCDVRLWCSREVGHSSADSFRGASAETRSFPRSPLARAQALGLPALPDLSRLKAVDQRPLHCCDQLLGGVAKILTRSFASSPRRGRKRAFDAVSARYESLLPPDRPRRTNACRAQRAFVGTAHNVRGCGRRTSALRFHGRFDRKFDSNPRVIDSTFA